MLPVSLFAYYWITPVAATSHKLSLGPFNEASNSPCYRVRNVPCHGTQLLNSGCFSISSQDAQKQRKQVLTFTELGALPLDSQTILKMPFRFLPRETFQDCLASCSGTSPECTHWTVNEQDSGSGVILRRLVTGSPWIPKSTAAQVLFSSTIEYLNNLAIGPHVHHLQMTCDS